MSNRKGFEKRWKILVTPAEACGHLDRLPKDLLRRAELFPVFGRVPDEKKLVGLLQDKEAAVLDLEKISREVIRCCPRLKVISRFGEGCDAIDIKAAKDLGVKVTRTRGASSAAVARHAMALTLSLTHRITENDANLKAGKWIRRANISDSSAVLGVLGFGRTGRACADLALPFGFRVMVYGRTKRTDGYDYADSLGHLVDSCDILSLHLPLNAETRGIINADLLGRMAGKYIVNTARAGLIDEKAVIRALDKGTLAGYATDVFLSEPIGGISKELARHPKVVATPHIAALDDATNISVTRRAIENAVHTLNGEDEKVDSYVF